MHCILYVYTGTIQTNELQNLDVIDQPLQNCMVSPAVHRASDKSFVTPPEKLPGSLPLAAIVVLVSVP